MLPTASTDPNKAKTNPAMFMDTGLDRLLDLCLELGSDPKKAVFTVAGGASTKSGTADFFQIGQRNIVAMRKNFWRRGIFIKGEDVGGTRWRTQILNIATGEVQIRDDTGLKSLYTPTPTMTIKLQPVPALDHGDLETVE
jgi:chemotaxis protein CheD